MAFLWRCTRYPCVRKGVRKENSSSDKVIFTGLEINFFVWEPAGDQRKNFGRQIVNFGRQLILYITTQKHDFISYFLCKKSHNFRAETTKLPLFSGDVSGPKVMVVSIVILNEAKHKTF